MTFADIPAGATLFLDANTFVYHYSQHPVLALPGTDLMVLEAATVLGWTGTGITGRLRRHPQEIQKLTRFQTSVRAIAGFGIKIVAVSAPLVEAATNTSRQAGLLSGDALIVAGMQREGLSQIASDDADFDRVPGLVRYAPL
jgi:predicted nucleic acid-binding protein